MDNLAKTPLYDAHISLGGKMVSFAGFSMPVQYSQGALREYRCVRDDLGAGIFDISHMAQVRVQGDDALVFLQYTTTNNVGSLVNNQIQYSALLNEQGMFIDDITTYRVDHQHYYLCINAANRHKDVAHLQKLAANYQVQLTDESDRTTLLALQGARAQSMLQRLCTHDLDSIRYYHFAQITVKTHNSSCNILVSRTGYTGEDGFELYLPNHAATSIWDALLKEGATPIGLAARDMLRSEMGYALFGHEISDQVTPVEARLMWITKLDKGDFLGRNAVMARKEAGAQRKLIALKLTTRGIPREGYAVLANGKVSGEVTTGQHSPLAEAGIALAYVQPDDEHADSFAIEIRGKAVPAERVTLPFVRSRVRRN